MIHDIDFTHWEKRYGRTLKDLEKIEIANNLTEFFELLAELQNKKLEKIVQEMADFDKRYSLPVGLVR